MPPCPRQFVMSLSVESPAPVKKTMCPKSEERGVVMRDALFSASMVVTRDLCDRAHRVILSFA